MGLNMKSILIVEDEKLIRQGIKAMIQRSGIPVERILDCNNGQTALDILKTESIDVLFTDIKMPKLDGTMLVEQVKKLPHVPMIVVISGHDDFNDAIKLLRAGVHEYIMKPIERHVLKRILTEMDEILTSKKQAEAQQKQMDYKQLRYYLLNPQITDSEKSWMRQKYNLTYLMRPYKIGCTLSEDFDAAPLKSAIRLEQIHGHDFYILRDIEDITTFIHHGHYIGISPYYQGIDMLYQAYEEALVARKKAFYVGTRVVEYNKSNLEISYDQMFSKQYDKAYLLQIVQKVGTYKIEEALRALKAMFDAVRDQKIPFTIFEENIRLLIEEVVHTYQHVLQIEPDELSRHLHFMNFPCLQEYQTHLNQWLLELNEHINHQFDDYKNKQKIQEALSYIKANFSHDLNMAVVSNHISMNYSLFSCVFKQYTGCNFVTYLKELRMRAAQKLLSETELKVNEVSHRVGYDNEKHFMKTFKALYGVSPTEYRKNMLFTQKEKSDLNK